MNTGDSNNNINFETDDEFEIVNKVYYELAAAIGLISGGLDVLIGQEFSISNFQDLGQKEAEKIVFKCAKQKGFKGDKLDGAIRKLEKECPWCGDEVEYEFGAGKYHHFRDFTHFASPFGLFFALVAQFSKKVWGVDKNGILMYAKLSEDLIGETKIQKFEFATVIWTLHLASDIAGSSGTVNKGGKGVGIPGNIISLIQIISFLLQKIGLKNCNEDWADELAKIIFKGIKKADKQLLDKRFELGLGKYIKSQVYPVIVNELLTRSAYSICKLFYEIREKDVKCLKDIENIDFESLIPLNNQVLTRMFTISSGTFLLVNGTKAAAKGLMAGGSVGVAFANVNYIGVGRFAIAIWCDKDYIVCDAKKYLKYYKKRQLKLKQLERKALSEFKYFALNEKETRLLNSIKVQKVLNDIFYTADNNQRAEKEKWLEKFKKITKQELKIKDDKYFINDENVLYKKTNRILKKHLIHKFFNKGYDERLVFSFIMQLLAFDEYYQFDTENKFKIKFVTNYEKDYISCIQKMLTYEDVQKIKKQYDKYKTIVSGSLFKIGTTIATIVVTVTLTGGAGLIFAPGIAVGLVGSTLALHGVALTSASLAIIGGGSLAVGGFGIFGGTVVITGGGALIGLIGSGIASSSRLKVYINSQTVMLKSAELLTYAKYIIGEKSKDEKFLKTIEELYNEEIRIIDEQLRYIKEHKEQKFDSKNIKGIKQSKEYIENSVKEIKRISKKLEEEMNENKPK